MATHTVKAPTTNKKLLRWVEDVAEHLTPDHIHWCDGSEEEYNRLCDEMVAKGTFRRLNPKKRPNSYCCASDPNDVARVEDRTFICTRAKVDAGPTNNWMPPREMKRKLLALEIPIQREEIVALRARIQGIDILHGIEVDIMPDGTLDFDDERLVGFDIVLASLHDDHGHTGARLTDRYIQAMRNPMVNVITHPANRSPAFSPGYDLDYDRLFETAVATGTALEIDGAPGHLDMDGSIARRAVNAGVMLTIDSDCHRAEALERQMRFGIGTARRGWVQAAHVLNTRSAHAVRAFVARKRGGR